MTWQPNKSQKTHHANWTHRSLSELNGYKGNMNIGIGTVCAKLWYINRTAHWYITRAFEGIYTLIKHLRYFLVYCASHTCLCTIKNIHKTVAYPKVPLWLYIYFK